MTTQMGDSGGQKLSRRRVLQAGLAAAAVGAMGKPAGGFAESRAQSQTQTRQAIRSAGVSAIDIHAHYYPEAYLNVIAEDGKRFGGVARLTAQGPFITTASAGGNGQLPLKITDLKQRIAEMDQQGVAMQAISLTAPMAYWGDAAFNHKLAVAWNDAASAAHQAYPTRLVALATLPMLDSDRAIDELGRAGKLPGVRGVYMGTNINNRDLDDPIFEPVWARIASLGLPVFLHPLQTVGGQRLQPFYLANLLGNPIDSAIAACHLIFGGVLDRHPKLTICLPHAGGALLGLVGRIDRGWQVRPEVKHLPQAPSNYLRRFYFDTIAHSGRVMDFVIAEVGADRVMIGSDYCFDMGYDRPLEFIEQLKLTGAQRKMILGGTAARLLKV